MELLGLIVLGVVIGGILGLVGAGGSILAVPGFIFVLNLSPHQATLAGAMVVGLAAAATALRRIQGGEANVAVGIAFSAAGIIGTVIGARATSFIDERVVAMFFAVMMIAAAVSMWRGPKYSRPRKQGWVVITAAASVVGLVTGLFGIGGGFLIVPMLILVLGVPIRLATGTSLVAISINAATAMALRFDQWGQLPLISVFAVSCIAILTSLFMTRISPKIDQRTSQRLFAIVLVPLALLLVIP